MFYRASYKLLCTFLLKHYAQVDACQNAIYLYFCITNITYFGKTLVRIFFEALLHITIRYEIIWKGHPLEIKHPDFEDRRPLIELSLFMRDWTCDISNAPSSQARDTLFPLKCWTTLSWRTRNVKNKHNLKKADLYWLNLFMRDTGSLFMRDTARCDNSHAPLVCPE